MNTRLKKLSRLLILPVAFFILLDGVVLAINLFISKNIQEHAVALNLISRDKIILHELHAAIADYPKAGCSTALRQSRIKTLAEQFDRHLTDLSEGDFEGWGMVGKLDLLSAGSKTQIQVQQAKLLWQPIYQEVIAEAGKRNPEPELFFDSHMKLLTLLEELSVEIYQSAEEETKMLRIIQIAAFILALINFFIIFRMLRLHLVEFASIGEKFRSQALVDELTGLANRRKFHELLESEMARVNRYGGSFTLISVDLDGFKLVNDSYGHAAGDMVLQETSKRLQKAARNSDTVFRIGGDEFSIVCPNLNEPEDISLLCNRLQEEVLKPVLAMDRQLNVGVSVGWATYPDHVETVDELVYKADKMMYQNKSGHHRAG
ncbi:MAG: GGDEF domain-containing protein [Pseudomonadota bacterium]